MRQFKIIKQITYRENSSLDKYLYEIGKIELITAEEEFDLVQKMKKGDKNAFKKLTEANLRFVISVAKQFEAYVFGEEVDDGSVFCMRDDVPFEEDK